MFWTASTLISGIASLIFLALFIFVIFSRPLTRQKRFFSFYLMFMCVWSISALLSTSGLVPVLPWFRVMAASPLGMMMAIYLFVQDLFGLRSKWKLYIILYTIFEILITLFTDAIVKFASLDATGTLIYEFGLLFVVVAVPSFLLVIVSLVELIRGYRKSKDDNNRNRIRYLTIGLFITVLASFVNVTEYGKYPIDIAANLLTALLITYAILRHQLLDIRVVFRLGLLYSITSALVGVVYFIGITIVINLFHFIPSREILYFSIIIGIMVAVVLNPIRTRTQKWIDRLFYREKFDAGLMLQRLSSATASLLPLDQIAELIVSEVLTTWHIRNGAVLIRKSDTGEFRVIAHHEEGSGSIWNFPADHPVARWLSGSQAPLMKHDLSIIPLFKSMWGTEKQDLERFQAEIFVPICFKGNLVGILVLGEKKSTQPYSQEDLLFLSALSNQTAVAFENARLYGELESAFVQTTVALANAIDIRDSYTNVHSQQIASWSRGTAEVLGCSPEVIENTYWGGLLHDIGKIGIPDSILNKAASLDEDEWEVVRKHPDLGAELISPIKKLVNVAPIIKCSHERYDGHGYPHGLKGEDIPIGARIVSVADSYSAMRDKRPYKDPISKESAIKELVDNKNSMYDPKVVDAFLKMIERTDK